MSKAVRSNLSLAFPTWKTIELGTGLQNASSFREALKDGGFRIDDWGNDILCNPAFRGTKETSSVELVLVSVAELGFFFNTRRKDIYERAISLGLELCPNEVGPQLRLQYKDQPRGEWLLVAMEPVVLDSLGSLGLFRVGHDEDNLFLNGSYGGSPGFFWRSDSRWVFARRK